MPRPIFMGAAAVECERSRPTRAGEAGRSEWHGWRNESGQPQQPERPNTMNDHSLSAYAPTRLFSPYAQTIVHEFLAHAADTRCVVPMPHGAGIATGAAHLPALGIDVVVAWPISVTRQALRAQSTTTGRHLILMIMRSPIVADDYVLTLVFNDAGTITFVDGLELFTNDGGTFWLSPTGEGLLHFQLRRGGLIPKMTPPWRDDRQRRAGFRRAGNLLSARLLGQAR